MLSALPAGEQLGDPVSDASSDISSSGTFQPYEGFILHKILKTDTLAGVAVRYNITVSDVKRANGFLSDTAMFAREYVHIPTKQLLAGGDSHTVFARPPSRCGRDSPFGSKERSRAPGGAASAQFPGARAAAASSLWCEDDDAMSSPYSRRSERSLCSQPGDVEMVEYCSTTGSTPSSARSSCSGAFGGPPAAGLAAGASGEERARRRAAAREASASPEAGAGGWARPPSADGTGDRQQQHQQAPGIAAWGSGVDLAAGSRGGLPLARFKRTAAKAE